MKKVDYDTLASDCIKLEDQLKDKKYKALYPIPRGGVPIAIILSFRLGIPITDKLDNDCLVVDDLVDSGKTLEQYPDNDKAVLYTKSHSPKINNLYSVEVVDEWIEFAYEDTNKDIESNVTRILEYLGEDPTREGLLDTPKRYIKFLQQFTAKEDFNFTVFDSEGMDQMIIQKDIPFFSLCEHHIAPFFGTATVAYIPDKKIVGLSKLARTVRYYAANLQNQERITSQVAERLQDELSPIGVAVTLKARHFCMEMRGVKTHDVHTVTTKLTGAFKDEAETRAEFLEGLG